MTQIMRSNVTNTQIKSFVPETTAEKMQQQPAQSWGVLSPADRSKSDRRIGGPLWQARIRRMSAGRLDGMASPAGTVPRQRDQELFRAQEKKKKKQSRASHPSDLPFAENT